MADYRQTSMKYEVITDYQKYVQVIRHTGTIRDYVELDLDQYDLSEDRIYAYKLGKNELIWDEARYQEILEQKQKEADQKEIAELEAFLRETDEYPTRAWEEIMALTNPVTWVADVIKITVNYSKKYKTVLQQRVQAWTRLDELKGE